MLDEFEAPAGHIQCDACRGACGGANGGCDCQCHGSR